MLRTGLIAAGALAAALGFAPRAQADCELMIAFSNPGEEPLTLYAAAARTRTPLGRWRPLWPEAENVEIAAGAVEVRRWTTRRCRPNDPRAFEFFIDRTACAPPGLPALDTPLPPDAMRQPDPERMLALRTPDEGFRPLPAAASPEALVGLPLDVGVDGGPLDGPEPARLELADLAAACEAARTG
jgi:hypothetical protein